MNELLVNSDGRAGPLLVVRKQLDDHVRLTRQVRWLTRAQGSGVVRLHNVGTDADHYSTVFGGPLTLGAAATSPEATQPLLADVWSVLERLHRLGLAHGAVAADHVVVGSGDPILISPGDPESVDRRTDIASFGRMVTGLAEVWSADATVDPTVVARWRAVGLQVAELGATVDADGGDRLVSGAEVRRLLAQLLLENRFGFRAGPGLRTRRRRGSTRDRRAGRRPSRS